MSLFTATDDTNRAKLDDAFAKSAVIGSEPREGFYRYVHPHRLHLRGVVVESKVWLKARVRKDKPKPFLIYGRPRSGTTLLVNLLNQVQGLRCDGELLHNFIVRPLGFLRDLPKRSGSDVKAYGVKLLSYQLMEVHRILRPLAFFDRLTEMNYTIIHITRNTWDQNLSLVKAQKSGLYFGENKDQSSLEIVPSKFAKSLRWNQMMLDYEREVMAHVPHIHIDYDLELKDVTQRVAAIGRICDVLGVINDHPTETTLSPTGGRFGPQKIRNMDLILNHLREDGLGHLIPKNLQI